MDKIVFNGKVFKIREKGFYQYVDAQNAVVILALDGEGNVFTTKEYRVGSNGINIGVPAGRIEKGETPEQAAVREFEEEVGYLANKAEVVKSIYPSAGISNELLHLVILEDLVETERNLGDNEEITVNKMTIDDFLKYDFVSASTTILQYILRDRLNK